MTTKELCPLCLRELGETRVEKHHLVPKTFRGKELVNLHKICHQKIHATFSERELEKYYHTIARLLENEQIQKFVKWVSKKSSDFYAKSDDSVDRKRKRKK